jgi:hypothetical protein
MPEDSKQTIENFVASALKSRFEEGAASVSRLRDELTQIAQRLEDDIRAAGEKPISLPDDLFPPAPQPEPESSGAGMVSHIARSQQGMLAASDQIGLLTQLLLSCTVSCPRVAFFIVRKDAIVGWAARGFEGAQDSDLRNLSMGQTENSILSAACKNSATVKGTGGQFPADNLFLSKLGGAAPAESMAVPVFIRDKIVAVLYGDSGQDPTIPDPELPEVLASHAGLCLETLATRLKYPRPKPGLDGERAQPTAQAPAPTPAPASTPPRADVPEASSLSGVFQKPDFSQSGPQNAQPAMSTSGPQPAVSSVSGSPAAQNMDSGSQVAQSMDSGAQAASTPAPMPAATPASAPMASSPAGPDLSGMPEDEKKQHEEARRFSRLLVSEIVLYNEKQAEEGRRSKDIYERLKDDIDRSLQMYEQRVDSKVRSASNYFYDEMVRTLANGDESAIKVPWA